MKDNLDILRDTSPEIDNLILEKIKSLSPEERFMRMTKLCEFGKFSSLEGLKEKNPSLTPDELLCLFAKNLHGDLFAEHIKKKCYLKNE